MLVSLAAIPKILTQKYDFHWPSFKLQHEVQGSILVAAVDSQCRVKRLHDPTIEVYSIAPWHPVDGR